MLESYSLARKLKAGEPVFTGWCGLGVPVIAEFLAREGFGAVTLDQQHGMFDIASTIVGIAAVHAAGAAAIVRIPVGDYATASRVLDFGADAVIAPMINSVSDARVFAASMKYPPIGERSWGPHRATTMRGIDQNEYLHFANDSTLAIAMIETRAALDNVEAIIATPGIDALFVGPSDLSITLSKGEKVDPHSKEVDAELDAIMKAAEKAGKFAGAYCASMQRALALKGRGYRFFAIASDLVMLRAGAAAALKG